MSCVESSMLRGVVDLMCSLSIEWGIMNVEVSLVHCSMWQLKLKMTFSCEDRLFGSFSEVYLVSDR